jgi:tetratricopeptide (TPR) repeat protein
MISALKALEGQTAPSDLRGDIREALNELSTQPNFKDNPLPTYQAGQERALLNALIRLSNAMLGVEEQEEYEVALQRKLNLDRAIKDGKRFLEEGKISEADEYFTQAWKFYKNETGLFAFLARMLMDAGEYVRALGHIRQGLRGRPGDAALTDLAEECARKRA